MYKLSQLILVSVVLCSGCSSVPPDLGVKNGQLTPCPDKPNCVSSVATDKEQYIAPLEYSGTVAEVKNNLVKVLKQLPNSAITTTEEFYIRAEFTSKVFHFVDDVEFYFPDTQSSTTTIHFRSASRVGHSDFGVNRERMELVKSQLKELDK